VAHQIEFTDRDIAALAELGEVGLMDTPMLYLRHYARKEDGTTAGDKYCQRRLAAFGDAGILESRSFTVTEHRDGASRGKRNPRKLPTIHRLTIAGADLVKERTGIVPKRPGRSEMPEAATVLHRLGVVRTRIAFDDAYGQMNLPKPAWIMEQDQNPDAKPEDRRDQKTILYESFGKGIRCYPDASALLHIPGDPPGHVALYLEYDRSTEGQKQILDKLAGYDTLLHPSNYVYRRHWPGVDIAFVRVIFVCRSSQRIDNLIEWTRPRFAAGYFRFALEADLDPTKLLTEPIWIDIGGQLRSIIRGRAGPVAKALAPSE